MSSWGSFTCRKSTTWDPRIYFPPEGSHTQGFYALKNPSTPAGFEPANLGTSGGLIKAVGGVEIFLHSFVSREIPGSTEPPIK